MTMQAQIPPDVLQRAVADEITRSEALKSLTEIPGKLVELTAEVTAENQRNMEYRAKLDALQFGGSPVLQLSNWNPANDPLLDMGKLIRLYADRDAGFPKLDRSTTSLGRKLHRAQRAGHPWSSDRGPNPLGGL